MTDLLGWASSAILLVTLVAQISKQWREGSARGVSRWLYVGQIAASAGFAVYSLTIENWVFVATNSALLVTATIGLLLTRSSHAQRHDAARRAAPLSALDPEAGDHLGTDQVR